MATRMFSNALACQIWSLFDCAINAASTSSRNASAQRPACRYIDPITIPALPFPFVLDRSLRLPEPKPCTDIRPRLRSLNCSVSGTRDIGLLSAFFMTGIVDPGRLSDSEGDSLIGVEGLDEGLDGNESEG